MQLAHACLVAGYSAVFPATWGDEIVAAACLDRIGSRATMPAIACACPRVEERLLASGHDLAPYLVTLVAPPVATARYLRALYGQHHVHITYVGRCPGANDEAIDETRAPAEFLASLAERNIDPEDQPYLFDSVIPPDRRRYYSIPGGIPAIQWLSGTGALQLVELDSEDLAIDLAQILLAEQPALVDVTPSVGCWCSGGTGANGSHSMRKEVIALEPPRARSEILDPSLVIDVQRTLTERLSVTPQAEEDAERPDAETGTVDFVSHVSVADVSAQDANEPAEYSESAPITEAVTPTEPLKTSPVLADAMGETAESPVWSGVIDVPPGLLLPMLTGLTVEPIAPEARVPIAAEPEARVPITPEPAALTELSRDPVTASATPVTPRRSFNTAPVVLVASGRSLPRAYAARRRSGDHPKPPLAEPAPAAERESDPVVARPEVIQGEPVSVDEPYPSLPPGRTVTIPLPPTHLRPVPRPGSERPALLVVIIALSIAAAALAYRQLGSGRDGRPASSQPGAPASVNAAPPQGVPLRMDSSQQTRDTLLGSTADSAAAAPDSETPTNQPGHGGDAAVVRRAPGADSASLDAAREVVARRRARIDSMARAMKTP